MKRSKKKYFFIGAALFLLLPAWLGAPVSARPAGPPHHGITVTLEPDARRLTATDTITLPGGSDGTFTFALHEGLNPSSPDPGVRLKKTASRRGSVPLELFTVTHPTGASTVRIEYAGRIHHPVIVSRNQARGIDQTPGTVSDEGVYLAGSSAWYPLLESEFMTFTLQVTVPEGWDAVSQGTRIAPEKTGNGRKITWDSPEPQNEIYLIASRFTLHEKTADGVSAQVYLRTDDAKLARKYLDATLQYIRLYEGLIGSYPYRKFALVENFWETGFGMPSFTLLGPTVLRLPFIINTSYPHEILHNWWGNSVYPVYEKGNWSEGLTAYMADHLLKEQQGSGAEYRMTTLQKYADYVSDGRDFPLTEFTSRHSASTEAIGYGKSLMFFHMLRRDLGDKTFIAGIRDFYRTHKFGYASFSEVQKSFEAASGRDLGPMFDQWVTRTGAPAIRLEETQSRPVKQNTGKDGGYAVSGKLVQSGRGRPYQLRIPVAVTMEGGDKAYQTIVEMNGERKEFELVVPSRPLRLDIDPEFDVFRRLDRRETPAAITQVLGAKKMLVVLPSSADRTLRGAYQAFAEALSRSGPDETDVSLDRDLKSLPADRAVVVLGWENRFRERALSPLRPHDTRSTEEAVVINNRTIPKKDHSVVLAAASPENSGHALLFVAADRAEPLSGLARKLPHYHKYSYLAFQGDEPANIAKGRWTVLDSPLTAFLPGTDGTSARVERAGLEPRRPLAELPPVYSRERMMNTVEFLSNRELKGREIGTEGIDRAADFIAGKFRQAGLAPAGDDSSYFQTWDSAVAGGGKIRAAFDPECGPGCRTLTIRNVIGVLPGKKQELSGQCVVVGAHYDHLGAGEFQARAGDRGKIHPGADDNASGVAVLIELAEALAAGGAPDRSIVFAAFTGEEEGRLGSRHFLLEGKTCPASKMTGMVNLDTVGRLGNRKLLVLGSQSAAEWPHIFRGAGFVTGVEIDLVSEDLDSSDQASFHEAGVPAVQLFSGPHPDYHRPADTPEKIDASGLVKVASVSKEVVEYLAGREQPLTSQLTPGATRQSGTGAVRKVGLGTIPDFTYSGSGVRLSGTVEGSPAEAAGLREGDVIKRLNGSAVGSLKEFSALLRTLKPGDSVSIVFERGGAEKTAQATAAER